MGYTHIYTGNGKGKTTAAFGLAIRALMSGKKVYIGQFVKDMAYHETKIANDYENLTIEQLGKGCFIQRKPTNDDKKVARAALDKCYRLYKSDLYDLIILDELCIALYFKLFSVQIVIDYFFSQKYKAEIVITGRYCPEELIEKADLVTEMKEVKHYFDQGVHSRDGFDR
jgi:cob(I)alamin adenosyltransferase